LYKSKKERLYIKEILPNPVIEFPAYYILSQALLKNEMLQQSLIDIHSFNFGNYKSPKSHDEIFNSINYGAFPVFKQKYAIGLFGGKLMYLESHGWKALPCNFDSFNLEN